MLATKSKNKTARVLIVPRIMHVSPHGDHWWSSFQESFFIETEVQERVTAKHHAPVSARKPGGHSESLVWASCDAPSSENQQALASSVS